MSNRTVTRNRTLQMAHASLEAKRRLELQQIRMPTRPKSDFPGLPDDPTELNDSELMSLMTEYTRWAEFLSAQVAAAEVDEKYAELELDKVRAIKSYDFRKPDAKTKAFEDDDFLQAQDKYVHAEAYRKLVTVTYNNADRNSALLSRELTRRSNRDPRERRADRYGA